MSDSDDCKSENSWFLISENFSLSSFDSDCESLRSFVIVDEADEGKLTSPRRADALIEDDNLLVVKSDYSDDHDGKSVPKSTENIFCFDERCCFFLDAVKEERKFRGHTYRRNSWDLRYLYRISDSKINCSRAIERYEDGSTEIAVSLPDSIFQNNGIFAKNSSLNRDGRFSSLIDILEEEAIDKKDIFNRRHYCLETIYSIPVIGHLLMTPITVDNDYACSPLDGTSTSKTKKIDKSTVMLYCGKEYDMNFYYLYTPLGKTPLQKLGLLKPPSPDVISNNANLFKLDFTVRNLNNQATKTCAHLEYGDGFQHSGQGWKQITESSYLQIDLGRFQYVTHLGTAGIYPHFKNFPTRKLTTSHRTKKRWRWPRKSSNDDKSFVRIVESMDDVAWVTEYNLYYCTAGKQWKLVGNFAGNVDSITENVHNLFYHFNTGDGIYTRYLRIQPTGHFNKPIMRVAIYGDRTNTQYMNFAGQAPKLTSDVPQCVTYTISRTLHRSNNKCQDGLFPAYKDTWHMEEDVGNRQKRKSKIRQFIKDCREDDLYSAAI